MPLCRALTVKSRSKNDDGVEVLVANMTVAYKLVRETFTSRVTLDKPKLQILVEYLSGPFSHLQNRWTFRPLGEDSSGEDPFGEDGSGDDGSDGSGSGGDDFCSLAKESTDQLSAGSASEEFFERPWEMITTPSIPSSGAPPCSA